MKITKIILPIIILILILLQSTLVNASTALDINKNDSSSNLQFKFSINFPYNPAPNELSNVSVLYSISYNSIANSSEKDPFIINAIVINLNSPSLGLLASMNISSMVFSKLYALQQYGITSTTVIISPKFQQTPVIVQILVYMSYKITSSNTTIPMSYLLSSNTLINLYESYSIGALLFSSIIFVAIIVAIVFLLGFFIDRYKINILLKRIRNQ